MASIRASPERTRVCRSHGPACHVVSRRRHSTLTEWLFPLLDSAPCPCPHGGTGDDRLPLERCDRHSPRGAQFALERRGIFLFHPLVSACRRRDVDFHDRRVVRTSGSVLVIVPRPCAGEGSLRGGTARGESRPGGAVCLAGGRSGPSGCDYVSSGGRGRIGGGQVLNFFSISSCSSLQFMHSVASGLAFNLSREMGSPHSSHSP